MRLPRFFSLTIAFVVASLGAAAPARGQFLRAIWGSGPNDIWAAGDYGNVVHFDGREWSTTLLPLNGPDVAAAALWGSGPTDVWLAGHGQGYSPMLLRWDGTQWRPVSGLPEVSSLRRIIGRSATAVFVVDEANEGDTASMIRWNGTAWSRIRMPLAFQVVGMALVGTEIWHAGFAMFDPTPSEQRSAGVLSRYAAGRWVVQGWNGRRMNDSAMGQPIWDRMWAAAGRVLLTGSREDGTPVIRMYERGVWRTLPALPAGPSGSTEVGGFLLGDGTPVVGYSGGGGFVRLAVGGGWETFAPRPSMPNGSGVESTRPADVWSAAGSNSAFLIERGRILRVSPSEARVVYDIRCSQQSQASTADCQALRAAATAAAPVAPPGVPAAAAAPTPGKGRAPPSGLPRPTTPAARPTAVPQPSAPPRPKP